MEWSYSASKTFKQCQRHWYFRSIMPNRLPNAKDQIRREAFFLSQLQSVEAWRGSVVDTIIENHIILPLKNKRKLGENDVIRKAEKIFNNQLQFAREFRSREEGMTKENGGEEYAALFDLEYGFDIDDTKLAQAWSDVETAIRNLLNNEEIMDYLVSADYLLPQRRLVLKQDDFSISAVPDVIAFYRNHPPVIMDWKVHTEGNRDYWMQLACYAVVLTQREPHRDFAVYEPNAYPATEVKLAEAQLLLPETRWYQLTESDVEVTEHYIETTANHMLMTLGHEGRDILRPLDFTTTQYPNHCETCPFQKLCGAETLWAN